MTTPHLSDLTWDRLLADDLPPALAAQARRHAAACAACKTRGELLDEDRRRFLVAPPAWVAPPGPVRSPATALPPPRALAWWRRPRLRALVPALALAVAAVVVLPRLATDEDPDQAPHTRTKGGFAVAAFAGRHGVAVALGAGDPVFPGDRLQITYSAERAGHLAVLAIDGAQRVNVYFPPDGVTTWPAAAGVRMALPSSTELDAVVGAERLWILYCDQPRPLAPVVAELAARGDAALPGCAIERVTFDKRSRDPQDPP